MKVACLVTTNTILNISKNYIFTLKNDFFFKFLIIVGTKNVDWEQTQEPKSADSEQTQAPKSADSEQTQAPEKEDLEQTPVTKSGCLQKVQCCWNKVCGKEIVELCLWRGMVLRDQCCGNCIGVIVISFFMVKSNLLTFFLGHQTCPFHVLTIYIQ